MYECPICLDPINEDGPLLPNELDENQNRKTLSKSKAPVRGPKRNRNGSKVLENASAGGQCTTGCGHVFHIRCLTASLKTTSTCPVCKQKLIKSKLLRVYLSSLSGSVKKAELPTASLPEEPNPTDNDLYSFDEGKSEASGNDQPKEEGIDYEKSSKGTCMLPDSTRKVPRHSTRLEPYVPKSLSWISNSYSPMTTAIDGGLCGTLEPPQKRFRGSFFGA